MTQDRFENFEILRTGDDRLWELGRGGMGVTYKARDTDLHRYAALKIIHPAIVENADARERFLREARAAARLQHPNIAGIMRLGRAADGSHFYAMDFCDGPTLEAAVASRGALPPAEAAEIARQVCAALVAAESQGIVHRDMKPSNLILTRTRGEGLVVKVIDFGLAKVVDDMQQTLATTGSGGFSGTAHFASPEQLEELPVDTRSDLYSLGACLWFMLTAKPVFEGSLARVMSQALNAEPSWEKLAGQPECLIALLRRLLAKSPDARPATASALKAELDQITVELGPVSFEPETKPAEEVPRIPSAQRKTAKPGTSTKCSQFGAEAAGMPPAEFALRFPILGSLDKDSLGRSMRGTDLQRGKVPVRLLAIDPMLTAVPAVRRDILKRVALAIASPHESLLIPIAFTEDADGLTLAFDWFDGETLMEWLQRSRGRLTPGEVASVLESLAEAADHVAVSGLDGTSFAKQDILIARRRGPERPQIKVPVLSSGLLGSGSAQATLFSMATRAPANTGAVSGAGHPPATVLARLACELLGGQVDPGGRIAPLPALTEAGNHILAKAARPDCAQEYPTAAAFVSAWTATVGTAGRVTRATMRTPNPTAVVSSGKPPRRLSRQRLGAIAAAVVLVVVGSYYGLRSLRQTRNADTTRASKPDPSHHNAGNESDQTAPPAPLQAADNNPPPTVTNAPRVVSPAPKDSAPQPPEKPRFVFRHKFPASAGSNASEFGGQLGESIVFSPNGRWLAARAFEGDRFMIRAWDLHSGNKIWELPGHQFSQLHFGFSPDSRYFISADGETGDLPSFAGALVIADAATGRVTARLGPRPGDIHASAGLLFSPDSQFAFTWSLAHSTIDIWDLAAGSRRLHIAAGKDRWWLEELRILENGTALVGGGAKKWSQWSLADGREITSAETQDTPMPGGLRARNLHIKGSSAVSPDGNHRVSIEGGKTILIRNAARERIRELEGHQYGIISVGFSPDGGILASQSYRAFGTEGDVDASDAILWDTRTWDQIIAPKSSSDSIAAFSPDGRFFVLGSGDVTVFEREPQPVFVAKWPLHERVHTEAELEAGLPAEKISPAETFTVQRIDGAPPGADPLDNCTLILRRGAVEVARYSSYGYILEQHLSPGGKYLAFSNRRGNSGDYLWMLRTTDGFVLKRPDDALGKRLVERAFFVVDTKSQRSSASVISDKYFVAPSKWISESQLRAVVHTRLNIRNQDSLDHVVTAQLAIVGNEATIESVMIDETAQPSPAPPPTGAVPAADVNIRLVAFADKTISDEQSRDIQRILTNYSNRVDYFKDGQIDLASVRRDKERYFSKWTNVTYKRVSPVKVTALNGNQWQLEFSTAFDHRKADGTPSSGTAKQTFHVALENEAFKIFYERGESKLSNPLPPATVKPASAPPRNNAHGIPDGTYEDLRPIRKSDANGVATMSSKFVVKGSSFEFYVDGGFTPTERGRAGGAIAFKTEERATGTITRNASGTANLVGGRMQFISRTPADLTDEFLSQFRTPVGFEGQWSCRDGTLRNNGTGNTWKRKK